MKARLLPALILVLILVTGPGGTISPTLAQGRQPPGPIPEVPTPPLPRPGPRPTEAPSTPDGSSTPVPTSTPSPRQGPIQRLISLVVEVTVGNLYETVTALIRDFLNDNTEGLRRVFDDVLHAVVLRTFPVRGEGSFFEGTWRLTAAVAAALAPATLALLMAQAAREEVQGILGFSGWKGYLLDWLGSVVAAALSLYAADQFHRLCNAVGMFLVTSDISGIGGIDVEFLINAFLMPHPFAALGKYGGYLTLIIIVIVQMIFGIVALVSMVLQWVARVALLYVLISLAPIALVLGALPPFRWLSRLWVKGIVLVELLWPAALLLLKLLTILHVVIVKSWGGVGPVLDTIIGVGVVSILLSMNGAVIHGVFGAAAEVIGNISASLRGAAQMVTDQVGSLAAGLGTTAAAVAVTAATGGAGAPVAAAVAETGGTGVTAGAEAGAKAAGTDGEAGGTAGNTGTGGGSGSSPAGGEGGGVMGGLRQMWSSLSPAQKMSAVADGVRAAGLASRGPSRGMLWGMGNVLAGAAAEEARRDRGPQTTPRLSPDEARGLGEALSGIRRDYGPLARAAGFDLDGAIETAITPALDRAAAGESLMDQAMEAGFGRSASPVGDYARHLVEEELTQQGLIDGPLLNPGSMPDRAEESKPGPPITLAVAGWSVELSNKLGGEPGEYARRLQTIYNSLGMDEAERRFREAMGGNLDALEPDLNLF